MALKRSAKIGVKPKTDIHHIKELLTSEESTFVETIGEKERFLASFIRLIQKAYRKMNRKTFQRRRTS